MTRMLMDILLARRFAAFIKILFATWKSTNFAMVVVVLVISVIDQFATYFVGILPSKFHVSLSKRDETAFDNLIVMSIGIVFFKAMVLSLLKFSSSLLYLKCREKLCLTLHRLYFKRHGFYRLNGSLDNPDQRMTQDVEKATRLFSCELLSPLLLLPFVIILYTYLAYKNSGILGPVTIYLFFFTATIVNKMLISPLVELVSRQEQKEGDFRARHMEVRSNVESIAFFQSGFTENVFTNNRLNLLLKTQKVLVKWQFWLNLATSSFDYFGGVLSYVILAFSIFVQRKFAYTSAAELNGIISENAFYYLYLINCFTRLIDLSQIVGEFGGVTHRIMELYEELNRLHDDRLETERPPSTVPSSVVALASGVDDLKHSSSRNFVGGCVGRHSTDDSTTNRIQRIEELHGKQALGIISTESDIEEAEYLLGDLELANRSRGNNVNNNNYDSENGGTVVGNRRISGGADGRGDLICDGIAITMDSVTIAYPDDQTRAFILNLSLQICQGKNILITGESGMGKTTLMRTMAGLTNCLTGRVERHWRIYPNSMLFLPQRLYFPSGLISLRQQLVYPLKALPVEKDVARLAQILELLRMDNLLARCNGFDSPVDWDWNEALSPGELQKLSIGRVLYHRPRIAFLDEATSALSLDAEMQLYRILANECITLVSVGHRFSLKQFHDVELHLGGRGGGWTLTDLGTQSLSSQD